MRRVYGWMVLGSLSGWVMNAGGQSLGREQAWEQDALPKTVEIGSSAGGFGQGRATQITLRRDGAFYRSETVTSEVRRSESPPHDLMQQRDSAPVVGSVSLDSVKRLISVMRSPPTPVVDAALIAPIKVWQADIDALWRPEKWSAVEEARRAAQAYRERLRDPVTVGAALRDGMTQVAIDLEIGLGVKAIFADGSRLSAGATGHIYRMLPWRNPDGKFSYSEDFPNALLQILPPDAVNREVLAAQMNDDKRQHLLKLGLIEINGSVDAIARAPAAYGRLRDRFLMRHMSIVNSASRAALMRDPRASDSLRLRVQLRRKGAERPVTAYAEFNLQDGDLADPGDLLRINDRFARVESDGVLKSIPSGTALSFEYNYMRRDEPLVRSQFVRQMAHGTHWHFDENDPAISNAFVVSLGPLQWMLLGDRRTVRWKSSHGKVDAPGEWRCAGQPFGTVMPKEDDPNLSFPNVCFGEMLDAEGKRIDSINRPSPLARATNSATHR